MKSLLQIENLNVTFCIENRNVHAIRNVSFGIKRGETLGLVGESGCGKSVTALSILGLISLPGRINSGKILFQGQDLNKISKKKLNSVRGKEISIIFQEPMTSLNPVFNIGFQISEVIRLHLKKSKNESKKLSIELFHQVGIPEPAKRYYSYPHELSGGMRQRVMIAIALAANPSVLIADEPTTALDVTIQGQILELLLNTQKKKNMSLLIISHDIGIVANMSDNVAIMYAGEIVEYGTVKDIFNNPLHPYTVGLLKAIPRIGENKDRLNIIPGSVPLVTKKSQSCIFYSRCYNRNAECLRNEIQLIDKKENHLVRCIRI